MGRIFVIFIRRLRLPFLLLAGFGLLCVRVYMRLEGLRWQDATVLDTQSPRHRLP